MAESRSSRALGKILDSAKGPDKKLGDKVRALVDKGAIHRGTVWRLRSGRGKADALTAQLLHTATGGRVPFDGWGHPKRRRKKPEAEQRGAE